MRTSNSHNIKDHYVGDWERTIKEVVFQLNNQTFTKKTERIQGTLVGMLVLSKFAQSNRTMGQNL
jgi:hypothetical protein